MAIFHLNAKTGGKAPAKKNSSDTAKKKGQSATAKHDYIMREGKYNEASRDKKLADGHGHMPDFATDSKDYWQAADKHERANGRLYKELEFSLPIELSLEQQQELVEQLVEELTGPENLPFQYAIHAGKGKNPHCHLMISECKNDGINRTSELWFRRAYPVKKKAPEKGGAAKTKKLKPHKWLNDARERWSYLANESLKNAGFNVQIDHRSKKDQLVAAQADREAAIRNEDVKAFDAATKKALEARIPPQVHQGPGGQENTSDEYNEIHQEKVQKNRDILRESEEIRANLIPKLEHEREMIVQYINKKQPARPIYVGPLDKQAFKGKLLKEQYEGLYFDNSRLQFVDNENHRIKLNDGSEVADLGATLTSERPTKPSLELMAEMAVAKGWTSIHIDTSNQDDAKAVARELTLRGIKVSNKNQEIQAEVEKARQEMSEKKVEVMQAVEPVTALKKKDQQVEKNTPKFII